MSSRVGFHTVFKAVSRIAVRCRQSVPGAADRVAEAERSTSIAGNWAFFKKHGRKTEKPHID